jgi:hypothetical protein
MNRGLEQSKLLKTLIDNIFQTGRLEFFYEILVFL